MKPRSTAMEQRFNAGQILQIERDTEVLYVVLTSVTDLRLEGYLYTVLLMNTGAEGIIRDRTDTDVLCFFHAINAFVCGHSQVSIVK
jgi:hypothetical protein